MWIGPTWVATPLPEFMVACMFVVAFCPLKQPVEGGTARRTRCGKGGNVGALHGHRVAKPGLAAFTLGRVAGSRTVRDFRATRPW